MINMTVRDDIRQDTKLMQSLQNIGKTTEDRSPERVTALKQLVEAQRVKLTQDGVEGEELAKKLRSFRSGLMAELKQLKFTDPRQFIFDAVKKLKIKDESGINLDVDDLLIEKLKNITIGDTSQREILEATFQQQLDGFVNTNEIKQKYGEGQIQTLRENITRIQNLLTRRISQAETQQKMKTIRVNVRKYLGATPLSKLGQREDIYEFWEEVSERYEQFKEDLDALFEAAEQSENEKFKQYFSKLETEFAGENLEYIARYPLVSIREVKPVDRLVAVLENLLITKGLSKKKIEIQESDEDDVDESGMEEWEQDYLSQWDGLEASHRDEGYMEEQLATDSIEEQEDLIDEERLFIDPLLAFEVMRNKKLLALTQDGFAEIGDALKALKQDDIVLDFQTDVDEFLEQIEDSFASEKGEYHLPISVLNNSKFRTFAKIPSKLPAGFNRGDTISLDVEDKIDDLLDKIHIGLTNKKFGFASAPRATGRGRTLGGTFGVEAGMTREAPPTEGGTYREQMGRIQAGGRSRPINPVARGKLDESLQEFNGIIARFLESANQYYITPMYAGRLPIDTPSFISGRGAKVLDVLSKDLGLETVMGGAYEQLASVGDGGLETSNLREIADFLEFLDKPNFEVTQEVVDAGEKASVALSEIFGDNTEERNDNYMSALLMHFMEEMEDMTYAEEDFNGSTIQDRAEDFERGYMSREAFPIFALPYFLDRHQGILTKDNNMKKQYNRLKKLFERVEDDLPIVLTKMLKAHDAIRKQLGKKVVYGFMSLTYDSVEKMIDQMYIEESVDLSHLEIENIVKSDDSHSNISKEYGINSEQVYLIKANFR